MNGDTVRYGIVSPVCGEVLFFQKKSTQKKFSAVGHFPAVKQPVGILSYQSSGAELAPTALLRKTKLCGLKHRR